MKVRSSLTTLDSHWFEDYADFMAVKKVGIISSPPFDKAGFTAKQRVKEYSGSLLSS